MPGVAGEKPAENTCSHKDPTGMALPAFPKGKPRYQESWGRALIDQWRAFPGVSSGLPAPSAKEDPTWRVAQPKGKNQNKTGWKELPAGWRTAALNTEVLFSCCTTSAWTEDEMVGWHHWLNGHEFEHSPGDSEGLGSLVCCSSCRSQKVRHDLVTAQQQQQITQKQLTKMTHSKCAYFRNAAMKFPTTVNQLNPSIPGTVLRSSKLFNQSPGR